MNVILTMKKFIIFLTLVVLSASCVESGRNEDVVKPTKNVILMVPDGTSTSVLSLSKWYKRYMGDADFDLNLTGHICGLMSSTMSDGIIPCSAPAMSGIVTGMPQRAGNLSIYPLHHPGQDLIPVDSAKAYQPLATVMEAARLEKGAAVGVVVTVEFHHATPAACMAHTPRRGDVKAIARQMASNGFDVVFGGGAEAIDGTVREILKDNDVNLIENDIDSFRSYSDDKPVWAVFADGFMDYDIDRDTSVTPSLAEMTAKAIEILSKDEDGFFLMVEGSKVDFAAHANDPNALITEFLAFDEAVGVAMDFAEKDGNTTVVVVPDHGTSALTACVPGFKGYTRKGIDSLFVDMKGYKATYLKLGKMLSQCKIDELRPLFKEWTGLELTDAELERLMSAAGKSESDYMQVADSENFESVISSILTSHTHLVFANSGHTPENVFLAAYHPKGHIPKGILTNTELNTYLCKAAGLKSSLADVTDEYFVRHDILLKDFEYEVIKESGNPLLMVKTAVGEVTVPAWRNVFPIADEKVELPVAPVYIKENDSFYLSRQIVDVLKNQ